MGKKLFLHWSVILPLMAIPLFVLTLIVQQAWLYIPLTFMLIIAVLASVHHAEVIADKVGEPLGTLILALAVTIIEVSLVISLMIAGGKSTQTLARDTVFSAVMIILTGIVGLCLLLGGAKYREQSFRRSGVNVALITLTAILVLTLVLPNFTTSVPGPQYSAVQLIFVGIISLILYSAFVWVQTKLHRDYFTAETASANEEHEQIPTNAAFLSGGLLLLSLVMVVIIAKKLSSPIELLLQQINAPQTLLGIIIAMVILLPEGLAAIKAARKDSLQTSLNLALGSALASIGLTIPAVAFICVFMGLPVVLGIDSKSMLLMLLSLFTVALSFITGKTTVMHGIVLLVIFSVYIFTVIVP